MTDAKMIGRPKSDRVCEQYEGQQFETTACYNGLRDEAAAAIIALQGARDEHLRMRMNLFNDCSEAVRRAEAAEAEVARLKDELAEAHRVIEPFATLNEGWVDEEGWTDKACQNDRICDWLGPSDFRRARSFLNKQKTGENG